MSNAPHESPIASPRPSIPRRSSIHFPNLPFGRNLLMLIIPIVLTVACRGGIPQRRADSATVAAPTAVSTASVVVATQTSVGTPTSDAQSTRVESAPTKAESTPLRAESTPTTSSVALPTVQAAPVPTTAPAEANLAPCTPVKIEELPANGTISFPGYSASESKDASGIYQLHVTKADGSPGPCLTCDPHAGGPPVGLNKMLKYVDPMNRWIVFGVEWAHHRAYQGQDWQKYLQMANGWYMDLWAVSIDGQKWAQLTHYADTDTFAGNLAPRISKNGSKMIWAKLIRPSDPAHSWGYWQMYQANFVVGTDGLPKLTDIKNLTNPKGTWYEPEDWSPDDSKFLFISNIESSDAGGDVWELDVASGAMTNLTKTPNRWDEHARFARSGKKIAWMSSYPYEINPLQSQTAMTELMLMNPDGSGIQQVTHFNTPGYSEYDREKNAADTPAWSTDGSQIILADLFLGRRYPERRWFKITFAGKCGG